MAGTLEGKVVLVSGATSGIGLAAARALASLGARILLVARDRSRGERLPLELVVKRQTSETADFFGLSDRGRLTPGMRADVNLIDYAHLQVQKPILVHDMPAKGRRFVQKVDGYEMTIAAGTPIFERGEHTGALPGKLVRAGRDTAALAAAE